MLEPTPILLAFLIFKRFIFLELVAALALARAMRASGPSRGAAVVALVLAVFGAIVLLAPVAGLTGGAVAGAAARFMAMGGGILPLLIPSLVLAASAYLPGSRGRGLDIAHVVLLILLFGLWLATRLV